MATLSFKVLFNDQARRFKLSSADWDTFKSKVTDVLKLWPSEPILQWKDSDGDYITINSQEEFDEAVLEQTTSSATSVIRVYVSVPSSSPSTSSLGRHEQRPASTDANVQVQTEQRESSSATNENTSPQEEDKDEQPQKEPLASAPKSPPPKPPPAEPVTHPYVECDGSGQTPLQGIRFHKIGENYDLNEAEFAKLSEGQKTQFELILYPGAQPIRWEPVVHYNIVCDASNVTPIFGVRFHKTGEDYDLTFTEFTKLTEEEKRKYELLNHPRAQPVPYYTPQVNETDDEEEEAFRQLFAAVIGGLFNIEPTDIILEQRYGRRKGCPARCRPKHCKRQQQQAAKCCKAGPTTKDDKNKDEQEHTLPKAPAAIGSYGPGIVRLQKFLISHDLMDASAIRWRAGVFGPRTQEAIYQFQLANHIDTDQYGVYDEPTAAALQALVNVKTTFESAENTNEQDNNNVSFKKETDLDSSPDSNTEAVHDTRHAHSPSPLSRPSLSSDAESQDQNDDDDNHNNDDNDDDNNNDDDVNAETNNDEDDDEVATSVEAQRDINDVVESLSQHQEDDDLVVVEPAEVKQSSSDPNWAKELEILKSMGFVNERALVHLLNHNKEADPTRPLEATIAALLR